MTSEQPPREAARPLRPLPSIDLPLLRSERSAQRSRKLTRGLLITGLLVGSTAALALAWVYRHPADEPGVAQPAVNEPSSEGAAAAGTPEPTFAPDPGAASARPTPPSLPAPSLDSAATRSQDLLSAGAGRGSLDETHSSEPTRGTAGSAARADEGVRSGAVSRSTQTF